MVHGGGAAFGAAGAMAPPKTRDPLAQQGKRPRQFHESGAVDVVADGPSEGGDEPFCGARPVLLKRLLLGIEEQRSEPVVPGLKARGGRLEASTSNARPSTNAGTCTLARS